MKKFFEFIKVLAVVVALAGCHTNVVDETTGNSGIKGESPFTIVMNINDPEIMMYQADEQNLVHYYGEKNPNGTVSSIKKISIENSITGNTIIDIDEFMRPTRIITYTGIIYELIWSTLTTGVINAYDPISNTTICASFDTQTEYGVPEQVIQTKAVETSRKRKISYDVTTIPSSELISEELIETRSAYDNNQKCLVTFEKCGDYYDPNSVYLAVTSGKGNWLGELHFYEKISIGKYMFDIPSDKYPAINTEQILNAINDVFKNVGFVSQCLVAVGGEYILCSVVAAGISLIPGGVTVAPAFVTGCTAAIKGLAVAATVNNAGIPGVPGTELPGPTLSDLFIQMLKQHNLLEKKYTDNILLHPVVDGLAGNYPDVTMTPDDNSIVIPIIKDDTPQIRRFYLEPSEPIAGEDYNAYAVCHCMPVGTIVEMSIKGTDGYTDLQTTTLISSNSIITLSVPGAEQGVEDIVWVKVMDESGNYISSATASLSFH